MIIKELYCFERDGGGLTVSPNKPEGEYTTSFRLIAEAGKLLTKDDENFFPVIDVDSKDGWREADAPPEKEGGEGVIIV